MINKKVIKWLSTILVNDKIVVYIFVFNIVILALHLFRAPFVLIDNTTILLIILVLITPFASHIKKIKWGDFEAELEKDIKKLEEKVEEIQPSHEESIRTASLVDELHELAQKDEVLVFAKLRLEIEVRLKRLFIFSEKKTTYGIRTMTQALASTGKIDNRVRNMILEISSILNRGVHGDITTEAKIDTVISIGIKIIDELDKIFFEKVIKPESEKVLTDKELEVYMGALYEVISVVPQVKKPYINKRILNQEQLDLFLGGYDEYAEFLVEIKKLK